MTLVLVWTLSVHQITEAPRPSDEGVTVVTPVLQIWSICYRKPNPAHMLKKLGPREVVTWLRSHD